MATEAPRMASNPLDAIPNEIPFDVPYWVRPGLGVDGKRERSRAPRYPAFNRRRLLAGAEAVSLCDRNNSGTGGNDQQ